MDRKKLEKLVGFAQVAVSDIDKRNDAIQYLRALQAQQIQTASVEELVAILK
jgi:hypothetical protein